MQLEARNADAGGARVVLRPLMMYVLADECEVVDDLLQEVVDVLVVFA